MERHEKKLKTHYHITNGTNKSVSKICKKPAKQHKHEEIVYNYSIFILSLVYIYGTQSKAKYCDRSVEFGFVISYKYLWECYKLGGHCLFVMMFNNKHFQNSLGILTFRLFELEKKEKCLIFRFTIR